MRLMILVLLLLVILVMLALAWHLIGAPEHGLMMLGTCMAVIAIVGLLWHEVDDLPCFGEWVSTFLTAAVGPSHIAVVGRHPPDEGTVLLH